MYPYYPPNMMPNNQYYYPPQHMPYYMQQMHGMPIAPSSGNMPQNMGIVGGMGMPPGMNVGIPSGMHPNPISPQVAPYPPQQPQMSYPNCLDGRFGVSHNSSTEDTSAIAKELRTRNSSALLGEINNSFGEQSFNGQDFAAGQCRYHKACSCFPME